ncbi:sodium:proton antiporter [Saccharopolyspora sp. HNM0983]|uniref:Sodium:proton antiporter n=1 Tax=Saccharopolyspora montiporae TaxID=2781240 RepID=A0A929BAC8_9PSEU|nr:sodium:proton antiporter [Saccharopolyspora sp. HNM0983]
MFWVFVITLALLTAAVLLVLVRLMRGPSTLDRIVSMDVFVTLLIAATCVAIGWQREAQNIALLAAFALLAFIGSVSAARLIEKKEPYR